MGDGECQQIDVGDLTRAMYSCRVDESFVQQTAVVGPEGMRSIVRRLAEPSHDLVYREGTWIP